MIGIVHAGITVSSLEKSIPFYRDVLELKLIKEEPVRKARGEKLGVPGAVIKIAVFQVGDTNETLELIEYIKPDSSNVYGRPVNSIGQVHVAFRVKNIEEKIKHMKKYGVKFVSEDFEKIPDGPLAGWKWIYFKDPDGVNMELIQES